MLYTASFYDPDHWVGQRYRVSRAHPRGRTAQWDTAPMLYPSRDLLRAYRGGTLDFATLSMEYRQELDSMYEEGPGFREWIDGLAALGDVTLLCFERGEKLCHRRVAAQWLLERAPELVCGDLR